MPASCPSLPSAMKYPIQAPIPDRQKRVEKAVRADYAAVCARLGEKNADS